MKKLLLLISNIILPALLFAQVPMSFNYQAVIRNSEGTPVANSDISVRISIIKDNPFGASMYVESFTPQTNSYGLINLQIGTGSIIKGNLEVIDWSESTYFLKLEVDLAGGTTFSEIGVSQLLSVPYALHSKTADSVNSYDEEDPIFNTAPASKITKEDTVRWNSKSDFDGEYSSLQGAPTKLSDFEDDTQFLIKEDLPDSIMYSARSDTANVAMTFLKLNDDLSIPCNGNNEGIMRYNSNLKKVQYCDGTNWVSLGTNLSITKPTVITNQVTDITTHSAISGGQITGTGGGEIIQKGLCWNQTGSPTIDNYVTQNGTGSNSFNDIMDEGIIANGKYYVRAYAANTVGTGYGNEISFITIPAVRTFDFNNVGPFSFTTGGYVWGGTGNVGILERGIIYAQDTIVNTESPEYKIAESSGVDSFYVNISGLESNKMYSYRAYAKNSTGTGFGEQFTLTTDPASTGILTDVEGNTYKTVIIGDQEWMTKNLDVGMLNDGTPIHYESDSTSWDTINEPAYCVYEFTEVDTMYNDYGNLYNGYAIETGKLCPTGWHVPTQQDWIELFSYLGGQTVAGGKLKSLDEWIAPNTGATNSSGFTALPGGKVRRGVTAFEYTNFKSFGKGKEGYWWTSSKSEWDDIYIILIKYNQESIFIETSYNLNAHSVRCVKD